MPNITSQKYIFNFVKYICYKNRMAWILSESVSFCIHLCGNFPHFPPCDAGTVLQTGVGHTKNLLRAQTAGLRGRTPTAGVRRHTVGTLT